MNRQTKLVQALPSKETLSENAKLLEKLKTIYVDRVATHTNSHWGKA